MKKVIVTGTRGFIGKSLAFQLERDGYLVTQFDKWRIDNRAKMYTKYEHSDNVLYTDGSNENIMFCDILWHLSLLITSFHFVEVIRGLLTVTAPVGNPYSISQN